MDTGAVKTFLDGKVTLHAGDCRDVLRGFDDASIDSCVTDPPYALTQNKKGGSGAASVNLTTPYGRTRITVGNGPGGFMGQKWDTGETAFAAEFWAEVLRVLKPGGHVVAFSGTRTYHRMACAIEDAGFEVRDQLAWVYGSGFPKSHDVSKGIDKAAGAVREVVGRAKRPGKEAGTYGAMAGNNILSTPATPAAREWQGWGTALKPAWEPICLARKPLIGTVAANVLEHGTGAINVDGCRVGDEVRHNASASHNDIYGQFEGKETNGRTTTGRWPANIVHDGSDEVVGCFPETGAASVRVAEDRDAQQSTWSLGRTGMTPRGHDDNGGSAARFFYTAKADAEDRAGSKHPTVKPVDLMQWLVRLVTPRGGLVLDPFAGSGTTGEAAWREGCRAVLIEREAEYQADIERRMSLADAGPEGRKRGRMAGKQEAPESLPLFGANDNTPRKASA